VEGVRGVVPVAGDVCAVWQFAPRNSPSRISSACNSPIFCASMACDDRSGRFSFARRARRVSGDGRPTAPRRRAGLGPYALLVIFVLLWGYKQPLLNAATVTFHWPLLHNAIERMPPVAAKPRDIGRLHVNWLSLRGPRVSSRSILARWSPALKPASSQACWAGPPGSWRWRN